MKAIILAAGRGSRMKELTEVLPKCLVKIQGKTLLDWQLEALIGAGISEIAIVTGYKRELLTNFGLVEFYNPRWSETNMVSSLACSREWLQEETCIVSYSDIFYKANAVESLMSIDAFLGLTYDPNWLKLWTNRFGNPLIDAETFRITPENKLAEIGNRPSSVDEVQGQYMGLLRFTPEGWAEVERIRMGLTSEECDKMHMTETLKLVIDEKRIEIETVRYEGDWGEIDSKQDIAIYENL